MSPPVKIPLGHDITQDKMSPSENPALVLYLFSETQSDKLSLFLWQTMLLMH